MTLAAVVQDYMVLVLNPKGLSLPVVYADVKKGPAVSEKESNPEDKSIGAELSSSSGKKSIDIYNIFLQLLQTDLRNLCSLLGREGYYLCFFCCLFFDSYIRML